MKKQTTSSLICVAALLGSFIAAEPAQANALQFLSNTGNIIAASQGQSQSQSAPIQCGLKPLPPIGCWNGTAEPIVEADGTCHWVFVGCGK